MENMIVEQNFIELKGVNVETAESMAVTKETASILKEVSVDSVSQITLMGIYKGDGTLSLEVQFSPDGTAWFNKSSTRKQDNGLWSSEPVVWEVPPGSFCIETPVCAKKCRILGRGDGTVTLHVAMGRM